MRDVERVGTDHPIPGTLSVSISRAKLPVQGHPTGRSGQGVSQELTILSWQGRY